MQKPSSGGFCLGVNRRQHHDLTGRNRNPPPSILDRACRAAYIARHDDVCCSNEPPPPPYSYGTGALLRLKRPPCRRTSRRGTFSSQLFPLLASVR
jgi:hypothetical protein